MADSDLTQRIKRFLRLQLESFLATPYDTRTVSPGPTWSLDWLPANSNAGTALLSREARATASSYLNGIRAANCSAVGLQIQYPLLDPEFPRQAEYLEFYRWAVSEARRRGMTVYAETSPAFAGTMWSGVEWDWGNHDDHIQRRIAQACKIVLELEPDYLSVTHEPDTELAITGHTLTTADCLGMIAAVVACRDGCGAITRIGGGLPVTAAWSELEPYGTQAGDFVTIHLYTAAVLERLQLVNCFSRLVDYATRLSLPVIVGEGGLFKAHPLEFRGGPLAVSELYGRDPYQTWENLDALAVEAFNYAGRVAGILVVNWFWSQYAFAYYTGDNPDQERARQVATRSALRNAENGRLTSLGEMVSYGIAEKKNTNEARV